MKSEQYDCLNNENTNWHVSLNGRNFTDIPFLNEELQNN